VEEENEEEAGEQQMRRRCHIESYAAGPNSNSIRLKIIDNFQRAIASP